MSQKRSSESIIQRIFRVVFLLMIIAALGIGSFAASTTVTNVLTPTPDLGLNNTANTFPTVPPEGTHLIPKYTMFHSSGVISLPLLENWDVPPDGEEKLYPTTADGFARIGLMFINSFSQSVVHSFVELDPNRKVNTLEDFGTMFDNAYLDAAWKDYTGGWKEIDRRIDADTYIINLSLSLTQTVGSQTVTNDYYGRQLARFDGQWLVTMRLVAPGNNAQLLDQLQRTLWGEFRLWRPALNVPLDWAAITDYGVGYVIKYPAAWTVAEGASGQPYTVKGTAGNNPVTLSTRVVLGTQVKSEDEAKAWLQTNVPRATLLQVKAETINELSGFTISYSDPDPDGNQRSAITMLLNSPDNRLFVVTEQSSARGLDLMDVSNINVPPELVQIRGSFFVVPQQMLIATITPMPTLTPMATVAP
jgi:hypothetical protein